MELGGKDACIVCEVSACWANLPQSSLCICSRVPTDSATHIRTALSVACASDRALQGMCAVHCNFSEPHMPAPLVGK